MLNLDERPIHSAQFEDPGGAKDPAEKPRTGGLWAAFIVLLAGLVAAVGYGYRTLKSDRVEIAQVPAMVKSLAGLNGRLTAAESALAAWAGDRQTLLNRLAGAERKINSNLKMARQHADAAVAALEEQVVDEFEERNAVVDARLAKIESDEANARQELARLQQEMASTRQEIASLRQVTNRELAGLHQRFEATDRTVESIARRFDRQRVDFEAVRNREVQITPRVTLRVLDTDVSHQKFSGWIELLPEARFLWVAQRAIQEPVAFYPQQSDERFDLVVTRVAKDSVVGYLLLPPRTDKMTDAPVARMDTPASAPRQARGSGL